MCLISPDISHARFDFHLPVRLRLTSSSPSSFPPSFFRSTSKPGSETPRYVLLFLSSSLSPIAWLMSSQSRPPLLQQEGSSRLVSLLSSHTPNHDLTDSSSVSTDLSQAGHLPRQVPGWVRSRLSSLVSFSLFPPRVVESPRSFVADLSLS